MYSTNIDRARHSVHYVHELIQTIFTTAGQASETALTELMPMFADTFSMVTTGGMLVSLDQVKQMFSGAMGGRPGLEIIVSDLHSVSQEGTRVTLRYKEVHRIDGVENARLSVVIIDISHPVARWHYLHETAIGAPAQ